MKETLILILALLGLFFDSFGQLQENKVDSIGRKQGEWIEYRVLPSEIIINDSYPSITNRDTAYIIFDRKVFGKDSEIIKGIGNYKNGMREGIWRDYYSNDTLKNEVKYRNGIPTGDCKSFLRNGIQLMKSKISNNNKLQVTYFDSTGKLIADTIVFKSQIIKWIYEN